MFELCEEVRGRNTHCDMYMGIVLVGTAGVLIFLVRFDNCMC